MRGGVQMHTLAEPMPCGLIIIPHAPGSVKILFEIISNSNAILHGSSLGGVLHQHGTGHGANAAGHRGDVACHGACFLKVHIAVQLAVRTAVDANIDHHGAGLDHIAGHKTSAANGCNQNIRVGADFFQVGRVGMADRNGCILASSNRAAGLPTMLERPMTTAFCRQFWCR